MSCCSVDCVIRFGCSFSVLFHFAFVRDFVSPPSLSLSLSLVFVSLIDLDSDRKYIFFPFIVNIPPPPPENLPEKSPSP